MPSPVLGIDLGTTNSVVACADEQRVRVLRDEDGQLITPSTVSFDESGRMLVGREARKRRSLDASNTIFSVKRLIGRPFRSAEVQRAAARLPFALEEGGNGGVSVRVRGESYTLAEISSFILRHVRAVAEGALGQPCSKAVITVPANFNELQRTATRDAGRIAGLTVLRILNEPTAAALAYGYRARQGQRIAVYDLGGGTFDISILELSGDVIEVVATAGDTNLGGDDFDGLVADRMLSEFQRQHELDLGQDPQQYERVRMAAEWIKCQLSHQESAEAVVKDVARVSGQRALDLRFRLSRAELQQLAAPLIARTFASCEEAMRLAHIRPTQLDGVILVGGQTRTPAVRQMVAEYFGLSPQTSVDPELVVAQGAALQGYALSGVPAAGTVVNSTLLGVAPATAPEDEAASDDVMPKVVGQDAFDDEPTRVALNDEIPLKKRSQIEFEDLPTTIAFRDDPDDELTRIGEYMTAQEVDEVLATARELPVKPRQNRDDTRRGVGPTAAGGGGAQPHPAAVRAQPAVARTHPPRPPGAKPNASSLAPPPAAPPPEGAAQSLAREAAGPRSARPAPPSPSQPAAQKPPGARSVAPPRPTIPQRPASLRSGATAGSAPRSVPEAAASQARSGAHAPAGAADVPASESSAQPRAGGPSSTASLARSTLAHADSVQHRASTRPVRAAASKEPGARSASAGAAVRAPAASPQATAPASATQPSDASLPPTSSPPLPAADGSGPVPLAGSVADLSLRPSAAPPRGHSWRPSSVPQAIEVRGLRTPANDGKDSGISDPSVVFSESTLLRSQFPGPPSRAPLLLDVTPHTLSVETAGGFCEPIIERNAPIPTEQTRVFSTSQDDQVTVSVRVCQGESKHTDENQALGQIELLGLRRGRRGEVSIAVTFIIDADGTLNVKAIDRTTGQGQALRVDLVGAIGDGDLERMRERQRAASR